MTTRKDFLASVAVAAATPAPLMTMRVRPPAYAYFNADKFQEILGKTALHRQVFGIKEIDGGAGLFAMNNSIVAYDEALAEGPGSMHAVAVLYHGPSILMAMSDALWNDVLVRFKSKTHPTESAWRDVHAGKGNPYLHSKTKDPGDVSVQSLVAQGCHFFVCNNAMQGLANDVSEALKMSKQTAHKRILAALVPGSMAVPAGVMALNACQEAKFTYVAT